jgi:hypothetical protein
VECELLASSPMNLSSRGYGPHFHFFAFVVALALPGCGSAGSSGTGSPDVAPMDSGADADATFGCNATPSASAKACAASDTQLRSCLAAGSGIFGVAEEHTVCGGTTNCGGAGPSERCSDGVVISATLANGGDGGAPVLVTVRNGIFALPLAPGAYEVCPQPAPGSGCASASCVTCKSVTVSAATWVRVDRSDESGGFGTISTLK